MFPQHPFIDGKSRAPREPQRLQLTDPATDEPLTEVSAAGLAGVDDAVAGAQRAFESGWRDLPPRKRAEIPFSLATILRANADEIARVQTPHIRQAINHSA